MKIYDSREESVFIHDSESFKIVAVNRAALVEHECHSIDDLENIYCILPSPYSRKEATEWLRRAREVGAQKFEWKTKTPTGKILQYQVHIDKMEYVGRNFLIAMVDKTAGGTMDSPEEQLLDAVQIARNTSEISSLLFQQLGDEDSFFRVIKIECQRLAGLFKADRAYLNIAGNFISAESRMIQWPNNPADENDTRFYEGDKMAYLREQLEKDTPFTFESTELMPFEAYQSKEYFKLRGVKSAALFPLFIRNELRAVLGIEYTQKYHLWKQIEIDDLKVLGDILGSALRALQSDIQTKESESKYHSIIESMTEGVIVHALDSQIIACNQSACNILGFSKEKLLQSNIHKAQGHIIHPDGSLFDASDHPVFKTLSAGESYQDIRMGIVDNEKNLITWISVNTTPLTLENSSEITGAITTFSDISEKIEAEKTLMRLKAFINFTGDGVIITEADVENPVITFANQAMADLSGYTVEELIGKTPRILQGPKTDPENRRKIRKALEKSERIHTQLINYTKKGVEYWSDINLFPILDQAGKPVQFAALQRDVSDEIRIKEDLIHTHEILRLTIDGAQVGTWVYDLSTEKTTYNEKWRDMLGITPEENIENASAWESRIHPADRDRILHIQNEHIAGKMEFQEFEYRLRHQDGHWVWILSRGRIIKRAHDGTPLILAGTHLDISSTKIASEKLSLSVETSQIGIWEWDISSDIFIVDERWAKMLGLTVAEVEKTINGWQILVHPDDLKSTWRHMHDYLEGKTSTYECEYRMKHKQGHWVWILDKSKVVESNAKGEPCKVIGTQMDISVLKQSSERIRKSEEQLAVAIEGGQLGIWDWDIPNGVGMINDHAIKMFGLESHEHQIEYSRWVNHLHPDDKERVLALTQEHMEGKIEFAEFEYRIKTADGSWIWIQERGKIVERGADGKPIRISGTYQDITARRNALSDLTDSQSRLSLAIDAGNIGVWDWNTGTDECYFSSKYENILGYEQGELVNSIETFYDHVHHADRLALSSSLDEHLVKMNPFLAEFRMLKKDGQYIWCVSLGQAFWNEYNMPERMLGTLIEITQRKKAEEILAREAQLTSLRHQINPHFLFNTLNSIRAFLPHDQTEARQMILNLSDYLRYSLREGSSSFVSLSDEINALRKYLDIEKIRFGEDLIIEMSIQPESLDHPIAPLLIQPIVENAIKYGRKTNPGTLAVKIYSWIDEGCLNVEISNKGHWIDGSEILDSTQIGINNISERLYFLYGKKASLKVYEEDGQVRVIVKIPSQSERATS